MSAGFTLSHAALLTTHFGDPSWAALLLERVRATFPELRDDQVFVVDQDRTETSSQALRDLLGDVHVLRYPRSEPHVVMTGHDHAHVLNLAVRDIDAPWLLIFDSDAHPFGQEAAATLTRLADRGDAVLAALGPTGTRTHPCFMLLGPRIDRRRLVFDEGQLEVGVDTGRLIHDQIASRGHAVVLARPEPGFGGRWGTVYEGVVYHHGSGSFAAAADPRLQAQAALWRREDAFFRRRVFAGRYALTPAEEVAVDALQLGRTVPVRVAGLGRRLAAKLRG